MLNGPRKEPPELHVTAKRRTRQERSREQGGAHRSGRRWWWGRLAVRDGRVRSAATDGRERAGKEGAKKADGVRVPDGGPGAAGAAEQEGRSRDEGQVK